MHVRYDDKFRRKKQHRYYRAPIKQEAVRKFVCTSKTDGETYYGIEYRHGACLVGLDAWRNLNPIDSCSYPCKWYKSLDKVLEDMELVNQKHSNVYYMDYHVGKE